MKKDRIYFLFLSSAINKPNKMKFHRGLITSIKFQAKVSPFSVKSGAEKTGLGKD